MSADLKRKYDAAFYANQKEGSRASAEIVLAAVLPLIGGARSAIDIGCGAGGWLKTFAEMTPGADIYGVDHPAAPKSEMFIDPAQFEGRDLSAPFDLGRKFDLAMSLEVAEHISPEKADVFLDNLARHADVVLFSAAIPRQGGTGHVNEQWPDYWAAKMAARGFALHDVVRPLIWNSDAAAFWYKQNALLFVRGEKRLAVDGLEDWKGRAVVHPGGWMKKTEPLQSQLARVLSGRKPANA